MFLFCLSPIIRIISLTLPLNLLVHWLTLVLDILFPSYHRITSHHIPLISQLAWSIPSGAYNCLVRTSIKPHIIHYNFRLVWSGMIYSVRFICIYIYLLANISPNIIWLQLYVYIYIYTYSNYSNVCYFYTCIVNKIKIPSYPMKYIHFCTSTCLSFSTKINLFQIIQN